MTRGRQEEDRIADLRVGRPKQRIDFSENRSRATIKAVSQIRNHSTEEMTGENTMKTAVITDSNSGITKEEARKLGLFLMPMPVIIDGEVYYEGENLTEAEFFEALKDGRDVTTSQPSPGEVLDLWDRVLAQGYDEIVYIPMSSGLSESCSTAKNLAEDYEGKVYVVDNHRVSVTQKSSAMDALAMVEKGIPAAEIQKKLNDSAYESSIYVAVDTLEFLKKGGRVTAAGAALGSMFNIKPILSIQGDKLDAFAKVRGMKKCETKMLEAIADDIRERFSQDGWKLRIMVAGSNLEPEQAEEWRSAVAAAFPGYDVTYDPLSLSVSCHIGPGGLGIGVSRITL